MFFVLGILCWYYSVAVICFSTASVFVATIMVLILYGLFVVYGVRYSLRWMPGFTFGLLFFMLGFLLSQQQHIEPVVWGEDEYRVVARLVTEPQVGDKILKAELECLTILNSSQKPGNEKMMAYFEKSDRADSLRYGDVLIFSGVPRLIDPPSNPGEFNYKEYLARRNITYSVYLKEVSWKWLKNDPVNPWLSIAYGARRKLQKILYSSGLNSEGYAVASAILLGNDDLMNADLRDNFVYAGAMHILCVSGLHVGIIFLIFNILLGFLDRTKRLRIFKAIVLLVLIWTYASVTGLSPSVRRAGLMVTLFIVGQMILRKKDNLNTLATSAVILLLFDPMLIFHLGFQLSYAAVLGILFLYNPIYQVFYIRNYLLDKIWSITALSVAAQLATFPIAVHYFHFFPNWFWLSNLVTYPLSFLVLTGGMAFILFSWVPFVSGILGWMLAGLVYILNYLVGLVRFLPFPGMTHLHIPTVEVLLIYSFIFMLFVLITRKMWKLLFPVMVLATIILSVETLQHWKHLNQEGLVVYNLRKHTVVQLVDGRESCVIADSVIASDLSQASFVMKSAQSEWGLNQPKVAPIPKGWPSRSASNFANGHFFVVCNQRLMILTAEDCYFPQPVPLVLDVLIITGNPEIPASGLMQIFQTKKIITDGSVPSYYKEKLSELADAHHICYFDTSKDGAFLDGL